MAGVSLSTMRTRARRLANQEATQSDFVSDAELNEYLNADLQSLYLLLIECRGHEYYSKEHSWTTVADQSSYALPGSFFQLQRLTISNGSWYRDLETWTQNATADLRARTLADSYWPVRDIRYRLQADNLVLLPAPQEAYTLTMAYVPRYIELVADADTFDGVAGWENWAVYRSAITMMDKEESDSSALTRRLQQFEREIRTHAGNRDQGRADVIQDEARDDWSQHYDEVI